MSLSYKRISIGYGTEDLYVYEEKYVREAVKELRKKTVKYSKDKDVGVGFQRIINEVFGERLT